MLVFELGSRWLKPHSAVPPSGGAAAEAPASSAGAAGSPPPTAGVTGELAKVVSAVRRVAAGTFDLLALEARRAGLALVWMIVLGLAVVVLAVTAWFGLMAALALCAVAWGLSLSAAILILVVLNLLAAAVAVFVCVKMSGDLLFAASRRQLANKPAPPPAHE